MYVITFRQSREHDQWLLIAAAVNGVNFIITAVYTFTKVAHNYDILNIHKE